MSNSVPPYELQPARLQCPRDSPGKNTGVGCHTLFQGIFPTLEIKLRFLTSPALAGWFFTRATWEAYKYICTHIYMKYIYIYMNIDECLLGLMLFNIFLYSIFQTGYFTVEIGSFVLLHLFLQKPAF